MKILVPCFDVLLQPSQHAKSGTQICMSFRREVQTRQCFQDIWENFGCQTFFTSRVSINIYNHVPEGLRVFPLPWSSRRSWSLHPFLGRPMFFCPLGLYCSARFGSLFVSILCTCCNHFSWYCFISFTIGSLYYFHLNFSRVQKSLKSAN